MWSRALGGNNPNFEYMIGKIFNFVEKNNIYDTVKTFITSRDERVLEKLPLFYHNCLLYPKTFSDFLQTVSISTFDKHMAVYKGANILTLLCCAVFHLTKLYVLLHRHNDDYEQVLSYVANYYHLPFGKWLDEFITNNVNTINVKENIKGYFNSYQYLIFMSFASRKLAMNDRPIYKYMDSIKKTSIEFNIDFFADIVKPLTSYDNSAKDIYNFNIISQYLIINNTLYMTDYEIIDVKWLYDQNISNNIFRTNNCNIELYKPLNKPAISHTYNRLQTEMMHKINNYIFYNINTKNFIMFTFLNSIILNKDNQFYNMLLNSSHIPFITSFCNVIKDTHDIKGLITYVFSMLSNLKSLNYSILINFDSKSKQSWLISLVQNKNFDKQQKVINQILNIILTDTAALESTDIFYTYLYDLKYKRIDMLESSFSDDELNAENEEILLILLEKQFTKDDYMSIKSFSSKRFGYKSATLKQETRTQLSANSHKPFYNVIKTLLSTTIQHNKGKVLQNSKFKKEVKEYFYKLYDYKSSLYDYGIDLDKYDMTLIDTNPVSIKHNYRTVDKPLSKNDTSKIYSPVVQKFNGLYNMNLKKRLDRLYVRTVESNDNNSNTNRIIKIRKYLQNRYKPSQTIQLNSVKHGGELQYLYENVWNQYKNMNYAYIIKYENSSGIDAGGLTKQFFTNVNTQCKDKYFKLLEDSQKYILNDNITENEAEFVGQLLSMNIMLDVHIDFHIPMVYYGHLMFSKEHLNNEELFLYFLLDLDSDSQIHYINACQLEHTADDYCNPDSIVNDIILTKYKYNSNEFMAFSRGFFIEKKIFYSKFQNIMEQGKPINDKIRIFDMDKLLTQSKLSKKTIKEYIFDKIRITFKYQNSQNENSAFEFLKELMMIDSKHDYSDMYLAYDKSGLDDNMLKIYTSLSSSQVFKKYVLMFWTGIEGVSALGNYKIFMNPDIDVPISHTCFNQLELPTNIATKQELYDIFMNIFTTNQHQTFALA
jgi:hypothetical protein